MTDPQTVSVGAATAEDVAAVVAGVTSLLRELRADPTYQVAGMARVAASAIAGEGGAGVLVARRHGGQICGVLSWTTPVAMRLGGPYCLIQELWVAAPIRSRGVAGRLLGELRQVCRRAGLTRVEVCLPRPQFPGSHRTIAFYETHGFRIVGPRALWDLP
ncbi:MAG TPA: GNAT family N-acetyltransferase [Micromonosporaceae bacterium]